MNPTDVRPFMPLGATSSVVLTGASVSISFAGIARPRNPEIPLCMRVYNAGAAALCWSQGAGSATATAADTPVPPGAVEVFGLQGDTDTIAAINLSGSTSITAYFTPGQGL